MTTPSFRRRKITALSPAILRWVLTRLGLSKWLLTFGLSVMRSPRQKRRAFAGYTPTAHDVFVCTYAKSGTNWMLQIAQQIAGYGVAEFAHIHDVVPWPDPPLPMSVNLADPKPWQRSPTGLRVIKTHYESDYVPYSPAAKYIIVMREPNETLVSGYHFIQAVIGSNNVAFSVAEWLALAQTTDYPFDSWATHLAGYWSWRERENVLLFTYQELKRDLIGAVRRVAKLMNVPLTEAQLAEVVYKSSYTYMKSVEEKFSPPLPFTGPRSILRRGQSGLSGELLSPAQQAEYEAYCRAELRRLNCDFPFDEIFETNKAQKPERFIGRLK